MYFCTDAQQLPAAEKCTASVKFSRGRFAVVNVADTHGKLGKIRTGVALDELGTANCYVVSKPGCYKFRMVKGNDESQTLSGVTSVAVLWETVNTTTAPAVGSVVDNVVFNGQYIVSLLAGMPSAMAMQQEPLIDFTHRYADVHLTFRLSKLKSMNRLMPAGLRREIGEEYYPEIRKQLATKDSMQFKKGEASVERFPDGKIKLSLKFPNFIMVISEITWEEMDDFFAEYFGYKAP